ncbi:MAG: hypothetical protein AB8H03_11060 [Saprospiraceae bacterium]
MKDKKDISDLIRDNQHKLEERPSARTWERLESKLDNQRSKGNTFLYRKIAMAAAVVALVAVISLITVLSDKQGAKFAKVDESNPVENWILQDLETVYTDASTNVRLAVEFQKELKERYTNPIEEGTPAKKLLASNKTFTGSVNRPEDLADRLIAMNKKPITENSDSKVSSPKEENMSHISEAKNLSEADIQVTLDSENKDINKAKSNVSKKERSAYYDDVVKNYLTITQQMEWIIGAWNENNSLVEWQKVNKSTILCDEFILKEKRNIGLQLIDSKSQESYSLVSEDDDKKIFTNKNSDQIILEKINKGKFTMTFLPDQGVKKMRTFVK